MTQDLKQLLQDTFPSIELNFNDCDSTFLLESSVERFKPLLTFLKTNEKAGFEVLMDLSAVDYLEPKIGTRVIYFLHNPKTYARARVSVFVERDQAIESVTDLWDGANWFERELWDLFGIHFKNHPHLERILMPNDWKGHPLRKDYPLTEEKVAFKFDAKPKIPSQILHLKSNQKNL